MNNSGVLNRKESEGYFDCSKKAVYSFLFVLPLILIYEFMILITGTNIRNGADVILKLFFNLIGIKTIVGFTLIILAVYAYIVFSERAKTADVIYPVYFFYMFMESYLYSLFLGPAVVKLTERVVSPGLAAGGRGFSISERLIASIGAGIYEEFVFRLVMISVFIYLFKKFIGMSEWQAAAFAIFWAAFIFSGFHYVGELGDRFEVTSFLFRFIAGIILSLLYFLRGYGIAVYTHALYDIKVFFFI